jgi:hypothetical protein
MKLLDILTEIRINSENGYVYNLSKIRNDYSATFTTENGYEYEYQGEVIDYDNDVIGYEGLDVSFRVENIPNLQQHLEKTEKNINDIWVMLYANTDNYDKELFDPKTNKGVINVDYTDWMGLNDVGDTEKVAFVNYIQSKFSAFNDKPIDLNQLSSYNIIIYDGWELNQQSINGFKVTSGNQELIICISEKNKNNIEMYFKLNLKELDENLLYYIKPEIKDFSLSKHIGYNVNTNDGNIFKVITTVFRITKEIFDSDDKLKYLSFTPVVNPKENIGKDLVQSKRSKLYNLYINQFYPKSYKVTGDELDELGYDDDSIIYRIIK